MAASISTTKRMVWRIDGERKFSLKKIAIATPSGNAKRMARNELASVPTMKGNTPNLSRFGTQAEVVMKSNPNF